MNRKNFEDEEERQSTVGKTLAGNQIYSIDHPEYRYFSEAVELELTRVSEREAGRRSTAQPLVFTSALSTEQVAQLGSQYPEFGLKVIPLNNSVQAYWAANRRCANEWIATMTTRYAETVVHFGGSASAAMMQKRRSSHIELDPSDEVMANDEHTDAVDLHRLYGDSLRVQADYQLVLPRMQYDDYLRGKAYEVCKQPHICTHQAEAICVDLSVLPMGPEQVALAMLQHGAELCHGFFPYCPEMLVQEAGDLGGSGVSFKKKDRAITFSYPDARAGAANFPLESWSRWLASHCFKVADGKWFQLELLKHRDCFMFFRMTSIDQAPESFTVRHALDLPQKDDYVLVESWRLKRGLRSDPSAHAQWEPYRFLVRSRIERRVREFAMQLDQKLFSRYAIKKQIRVVNNRFVVSGTSVSVAPALDPDQVEDITTAIFSQVFVMRYESSRLSTEMMSALKKITQFHSSSTTARVALIAASVTSWLWQSTVGKVNAAIRNVVDALNDYVGVSGNRSMSVWSRPAPTYMSLHSYAAGWRSIFERSGETLYRDRTAFVDAVVVPSGMAGSMASLMSKFTADSKSLANAGLSNVVRLCTSLVDVRQGRRVDDVTDQLIDKVRQLNEVDSVRAKRYQLGFMQPELVAQVIESEFKGAKDVDPVSSLNALYASALPAVARQAMEYDSFSLSLDPQDRTLAAPYLRMPTYFGLPPAPRYYYRSKLQALNVPKRQNTSQELLSAVAARNMAAPAISLPQEDVLIKNIWENFLDTMCLPDAREKLLDYQADPVALSEEGLREWGDKAKPGAAERVKVELEKNSEALSNMRVDEYLAMLKADVKPTLSDKPLREMTAPQVIVYHEKALSALYSSIFRVLVTRFLSLLKPEIFVNLLKDVGHMAQRATAIHPFGEELLKYLENDFSKYDKSQSQFAFDLEYFVFLQLGMNLEFLNQWLHGHVECNLRSVACGLSLHVMYQRKSGDATTAFGNVILNILSVSFAYAGTEIVWAFFMGDDSLVCARKVNTALDSVRILAEVFNLTAKCFITDAPYFASQFVDIDEEAMVIVMRPDPIKRIEKLSMHISAEDPQWEERHASFQDSMVSYKDARSALRLAALVPQRYEVPEGFVRAGASALGTMTAAFDAFRNTWELTPELIAG